MTKVAERLAVALILLVMAACGDGGSSSLPGGTDTPTVVRAKSAPAQGTITYDNKKGVTALSLGVDSEGLIRGLKSSGYKWSDVDSAAFVANTTTKAGVSAGQKEISLSANYTPIRDTKIMIKMKDGNEVAVNFDTIDFYTNIAVTYEESGDTFRVSPHI